MREDAKLPRSDGFDSQLENRSYATWCSANWSGRHTTRPMELSSVGLVSGVSLSDSKQQQVACAPLTPRTTC